VKFAWIKEHADTEEADSAPTPTPASASAPASAPACAAVAPPPSSSRWPLTVVCEVLEVSRGGYYAWRKRPVSARKSRRAELVEQVRTVHAQSRGTYGSPRVHAELVASGVSVCENTVARVMREEGVRSVTARKFRCRTTDSAHAHPIADNVLNRDFAADRPDRKWSADITYVQTDEGWLYLAAVIDLCTRRVVGWAMADHLRAELCTDALSMALGRRNPKPGAGLVHHSDRGVQYACGAYRELLAARGITCSMSRRGDCYDNAVSESFWGTFKCELVYLEHYATRAQAKASIFEWIECWYNRKRRHSALGFKSPEEFETELN
jgi:transposase InsO family protein